jgi:hypothetical protein
MPFSCFKSKNACIGGFSFGSYSANDKKQSQIILFYRCCTCIVLSLIGTVCYSLDEELKSYVTFWMIAAIFLTFCDQNSNFRLLDLSATEH